MNIVKWHDATAGVFYGSLRDGGIMAEENYGDAKPGQQSDKVRRMKIV
jgi:hypothetical protein